MKHKKTIGIFLILVTAVLSVVTFFDIKSRQVKYPNKNIVLAVAAGEDSMEYLAAKQLSILLGKYIGQTVLVRTYPNNSGDEAREFVEKATDDGYTILISKEPKLKDEDITTNTNILPLSIILQEEIVIASDYFSKIKYLSDIVNKDEIKLYITSDDNNSKIYQGIFNFMGIKTRIIELTEFDKTTPPDISDGIVVGTNYNISSSFNNSLNIIGSIFDKELYIKSSRGISVEGFKGGEEISLNPIVISIKATTNTAICNIIKQAVNSSTEDKVWQDFLQKYALVDMVKYTFGRESEYIKEIREISKIILGS